jgi:hypothetical protein
MAFQALRRHIIPAVCRRGLNRCGKRGQAIWVETQYQNGRNGNLATHSENANKRQKPTSLTIAERTIQHTVHEGVCGAQERAPRLAAATREQVRHAVERIGPLGPPERRRVARRPCCIGPNT